MRSDLCSASPPFNITIFNLSTFEDLYYAAVAKLKDLLQGVEILLANGFKAPHDPHFKYGSLPLMCLGPITVGDFRAFLLAQHSLIFNEELVRYLDKSILMKSIRDKNYDSQLSTDPSGMPERARWLPDVSNMSCGMIFGELAEKYRHMLVDTISGEARNNRESTPYAPRVLQEEAPMPQYVSPYNLNERAKKLNTPGGPDMPCICDPECICALLCAGEPTRNCLCEENGLFTRVTEGMDIDDLDVPDLVRQEDHGADSSENVAASSPFTAVTSAQWSAYMAAWDPALAPNNDLQNIEIDDLRHQRREQRTQAINDLEVSEITPTSAHPFDHYLSAESIARSSVAGEYQLWDSFPVTPRRVSSLSYRDTLRQPFSKQCDTPPKRIRNHSSVAQRFFKAGSGRKVDKRRSVAEQGISSARSCSEITEEGYERGMKRKLTDVSFPSWKRSLKRESLTWAV